MLPDSNINAVDAHFLLIAGMVKEKLADRPQWDNSGIQSSSFSFAQNPEDLTGLRFPSIGEKSTLVQQTGWGHPHWRDVSAHWPALSRSVQVHLALFS